MSLSKLIIYFCACYRACWAWTFSLGPFASENRAVWFALSDPGVVGIYTFLYFWRSLMAPVFIWGLFFIFYAFDPYLRVLRDSCLFWTCGETVTIMHVFELPPRESARIRVSLDSRYGKCWAYGSLNAFIRRPRVDKLWLILLASASPVPWASVLAQRSEPARSTSWSFPILLHPLISSFITI